MNIHSLSTAVSTGNVSAIDATVSTVSINKMKIMIQYM